MEQRRMRITEIGRVVRRGQADRDGRGSAGSQPVAEVIGTATLGGAIAEAARHAAEMHAQHGTMAWPEVRWEDAA